MYSCSTTRTETEERRKKTGMLQEVRGFLANKDQNMSSLAIQWLWGISQFPRAFQSLSDLNNSSSALRAMYHVMQGHSKQIKFRAALPNAHSTVSSEGCTQGTGHPSERFKDTLLPLGAVLCIVMTLGRLWKRFMPYIDIVTKPTLVCGRATMTRSSGKN